MPKINAKGLTVSCWNSYYKMYRGYIRMHQLEQDFSQEIELISLEAQKYNDLREARNAVGRGWYRFIRNCGLRKLHNGFAAVEVLPGETWWRVFTEIGVPPK